ncbi:MAG TPA: SRPBCC family protein [Chthoniobacterales bacterium]
MGHISKSIEVNAPLQTVYNQWTQFETFPEFMEGVEEVRQITEKKLYWRAKIGGSTKEWQADIIEQEPDRRIAWKSSVGTENAGAISFEAAGPDKTRLTLELGYEPDSVVEKVGDALGVAGHRVEGDLKRFKAFIERRGASTGAYRKSI